ncbi:MAG: MurR/RpiR family transcriptional regulator [Clostridia bacterium]|nr:MurR/RpiR family transcriptional regulator [Clostridia bacterium]MBR5044220.1 MurR/RpiR family transcriptional regulator [Clostridia bacterium]
MDRVSLKIKMLYDRLGAAEKKIADWIAANPGKIISLSIVELAEQCKCSEATIVRFSKKIGLEGYQDLKISLASENTTTVSTTISAADPADVMFDKVCNEIYCSLELTKKALDPAALSAAAKAICSAGKIAVFGLGNSASVALDAGHKFIRAGLNATAYSDNHMQMIVASHLSVGDVVIGVSHSGSSKDIVDALKVAKEHGATTIAITNVGRSPIDKVADIVLHTSSSETAYSILALNSRIAQLAIVDTLYYYVVFNLSDKAIESIKETERSLQSKKY